MLQLNHIFNILFSTLLDDGCQGYYHDNKQVFKTILHWFTGNHPDHMTPHLDCEYSFSRC